MAVGGRLSAKELQGVHCAQLEATTWLMIAARLLDAQQRTHSYDNAATVWPAAMCWLQHHKTYHPACSSKLAHACTSKLTLRQR